MRAEVKRCGIFLVRDSAWKGYFGRYGQNIARRIGGVQLLSSSGYRAESPVQNRFVASRLNVAVDERRQLGFR